MFQPPPNASTYAIGRIIACGLSMLQILQSPAIRRCVEYDMEGGVVLTGRRIGHDP
jgi:hypothetical protein